MIRKLLPHGMLILAEVFIALNILDTYNPAMDFLTSGTSKALLGIFCAFSLILSVGRMLEDRQRSREASRLVRDPDRSRNQDIRFGSRL